VRELKLLRPRGRQRTDLTHVLAAVRTLNGTVKLMLARIRKRRRSSARRPHAAALTPVISA